MRTCSAYIIKSVRTASANYQVLFQLNSEEWQNLKSQIATSSWGGRRKLPYVFTEHGVLMLSSVLNSKSAIAMNIHIMRVFTKLREMLLTHKDLLLKMNQLEQRVSDQDNNIEQVLAYLRQFINDQEQSRNLIGFRQKSSR